jgi:histidinol dehydrogenase
VSAPPIAVARLVRFTGALDALTERDRATLLGRASEGTSDLVRERTRAIVARVRDEGDAALFDLARELDGVALSRLDVPRSEWDDALATLDAGTRRPLERAARNIRVAHEAFRPVATVVETEPGVTVGRRPDPLARIGVYAPGGRAAYPSSVLMAAVPARVAGVGEVILCTPPERSSGAPAPIVLAAAAIAGVDRVFAIGGAGAIAAMAYGTATVPRVDRIVGPGNAYVAAAKLEVASVVGIDAPAGPSELLVIADASAHAEIIACEVVAQAEHDPDAAVVVIALTARIAEATLEALAERVKEAPRRAIIEAALAGRGAILVARTLADACAFATSWAPEHLLLAIADPAAALATITNAGTVFLGESSSVAFGDYMTGANHVLPTGGLARAYSGLSTLDFVRWTTYQSVDRSAAGRLASDVAALARAEGLPAHAAAAESWCDAEPRDV